MSTYTDVDARCATLPVELTTTDYYSTYRQYINGDIGIASWTSYVGPTPALGFPANMRFGLVAPVYKSASLLDLNMDTIFQPDDAGQTILVCFGTGGNTRIAIGAALPFNILIPDVIRAGITTCSAGYDSGPDTTWRYYTFDQNTSLTFMVTIGYANSRTFNFFKGLDIASFPIFIKAFGTHSATIGTLAAPETSQNIGATIAELDMRDRYLSGLSVVEGGPAGLGSGRTAIVNVSTFVVDYERAKMGALVPPWNQPNRTEAAPAGLNWGAQTSRLGGALFALGGRVSPLNASDPGGIVAEQIHMTSKVDYAGFTVFSAGQMNGSATAPFITYADRMPYNTAGRVSGVSSERQTGFAPTVVDPGGQVDWSLVQEAMSVSLTRQAVEPWNAGGVTSTPAQMPGSSLNNLVIGDITDNTTVAMQGYLGMGEVTNPSHDTYYVPAKTNNNRVRVQPINRNGEIFRGTGRPATDLINAGVLKTFTLRNPTMNFDATRYPDYFVMYISDPTEYPMIGKALDLRMGAENIVDLNRLWKFYGNLKGKSGAAAYSFTVPYIQVGSRLIGGTTANVPRPWQGAGSIMNAVPGNKMEWELSDVIIGTNPAEGSMLSAFAPVFDYQNHDMNWYNIGFRWGSKETAVFFWRF
jgi:hypothetical protein